MTMLEKILVTSHDPQGLHAVSIFETAYNQSNLDDTLAQRLSDRAEELQSGIAKLIAELSRSDRYSLEETASDYAYPNKYDGPKPIAEQVRAIARLFHLDQTLALEYIKSLPPLPAGAEGWFAIPSVNALVAKYFPEVTDSGRKYCLSTELVLAKIATARPFTNYSGKYIIPDRFKASDRTTRALDLIAGTQKGDILIVPAQLGLRHRGRSVRRAREVFVGNEFGLGVIAAGSIILTHPERLFRQPELSLELDCPGDEFDWQSALSVFLAPSFFSEGAQSTGFDMHYTSARSVFSAPASGFLF